MTWKGDRLDGDVYKVCQEQMEVKFRIPDLSPTEPDHIGYQCPACKNIEVT